MDSPPHKPNSYRFEAKEEEAPSAHTISIQPIDDSSSSSAAAAALLPSSSPRSHSLDQAHLVSPQRTAPLSVSRSRIFSPARSSASPRVATFFPNPVLALSSSSAAASSSPASSAALPTVSLQDAVSSVLPILAATSHQSPQLPPQHSDALERSDGLSAADVVADPAAAVTAAAAADKIDPLVSMVVTEQLAGHTVPEEIWNTPVPATGVPTAIISPRVMDPDAPAPPNVTIVDASSLPPSTLSSSSSSSFQLNLNPRWRKTHGSGVLSTWLEEEAEERNEAEAAGRIDELQKEEEQKKEAERDSIEEEPPVQPSSSSSVQSHQLLSVDQVPPLPSSDSGGFHTPAYARARHSSRSPSATSSGNILLSTRHKHDALLQRVESLERHQQQPAKLPHGRQESVEMIEFSTIMNELPVLSKRALKGMLPQKLVYKVL